jgi:hypothetical protein
MNRVFWYLPKCPDCDCVVGVNILMSDETRAVDCKCGCSFESFRHEFDGGQNVQKVDITDVELRRPRCSSN